MKTVNLFSLAPVAGESRMYKRIVPMLFVSLALALFAGHAGATIIAVPGGTSAPATTLGPYTMTPFPGDTRPIGNTVTSVASPLGGSVQFSAASTHVKIGQGWATWSNGYTGDVYTTGAALSLGLTLPAGTGAFYFFAEPNTFAVFNITATTGPGGSITQAVDGSAGASYFGFYATGTSLLSGITISAASGSGGFAIGEFGIASIAVPEPPILPFFLIGLAGLGFALILRRRIQSQ